MAPTFVAIIEAGSFCARLMKDLTLTLHTAEMVALRRAQHDLGGIDLELAAAVLLKEALIAGGYLELAYEMDEDTDTETEGGRRTRRLGIACSQIYSCLTCCGA